MKIKTLSGHFIYYKYLKNRGYKGIKDRFLKNTLKALDFLFENNILTITYLKNDSLKTVNILNVLIADKKHDITIQYCHKNAYNHKRQVILFLDTHGIVFRKDHKKDWQESNKGYNSPVVLLSHELIHCYNQLFERELYTTRKQDQSQSNEKITPKGNNLSFPNAEEAFVISVTNEIAEKLGEDKRNNYGRDYIKFNRVLPSFKDKC